METKSRLARRDAKIVTTVNERREREPTSRDEISFQCLHDIPIAYYRRGDFEIYGIRSYENI
jgi:hypothetical protein